MKQKLLAFLILSSFLASNSAYGAETSGVLPTDPSTQIPYNIEKYGDTFEISWTTKFKKTSKCKNSQIQFTSKRFLGAPEERAGGNGFYFYSADFKTILQKLHEPTQYFIFVQFYKPSHFSQDFTKLYKTYIHIFDNHTFKTKTVQTLY